MGQHNRQKARKAGALQQESDGSTGTQAHDVMGHSEKRCANGAALLSILNPAPKCFITFSSTPDCFTPKNRQTVFAKPDDQETCPYHFIFQMIRKHVHTTLSSISSLQTVDIAQWLDLGHQHSNPKTLGSIHWRGRVRDSFSVLPSQLLCRLQVPSISLSMIICNSTHRFVYCPSSDTNCAFHILQVHGPQASRVSLSVSLSVMILSKKMSI